ncbi:MAG: 30S ribosome-binding factor RbfA [Deltaproteobacteria bacterium]|nr:30S ribosome-binding factor RbfA [Deltaproteobacteria bacterium]
MKTFRRADRVAPLIKQILAELLARRVKDPRLAAVVLTRVDIGDDLRLAKVGFRIVAGGCGREAAELALESARGFLRKELGDQLKMKFTPELRFRFDESVDHVESVERILKELDLDRRKE